MLVLIPIILVASSLYNCLASVPNEYRKINAQVPWYMFAGYVVLALANVFAVAAPLAAGWFALLGILIALVIKAVSFIGLERSYRAYANENSVLFPVSLTVLSWTASILDFLAFFSFIAFSMLGGFLAAGNNYAAPLPSWSVDTLWVISGIAMLASFFYLISANSFRNKMSAEERAKRREKTDQVVKAKKAAAAAAKTAMKKSQ